MAPDLLACSLLLAPSLAPLFAHFDVVRCFTERLTWQGTEGGLSAKTHEELNPANHHMSELESISFPVESLDEIAALADTLIAGL